MDKRGSLRNERVASRKLQQSGLLQLIEEAALQEIQDPHSYQSKAFSWMENSQDILVFGDEQIIQRYALACIFFSTNSRRTAYTDQEYGPGATIPEWKIKYGWLNKHSECTWYGITCDAKDRVTAIDLVSTTRTYVVKFCSVANCL